MRVTSRGDTAHDLTANSSNPNDTLDDRETVLWFHEHGPLRLIETETTDLEPNVYRVEGHADDAGEWCTVEFDDPPSGERARMYVAAYLAAGGFRPSSDPAHHVPRSVALLPRRYLAAYLFGATSNGTEWVASALSHSGNEFVEPSSVGRDSLYTYMSDVRRHHADLWPADERETPESE